MKIKLTKGLKLKTKTTVYIKNQSYNNPSPGTLSSGTIVEVSGSPTRLSDVPFKVLTGTGKLHLSKITSTGEEQIEKQICSGDSGFFFAQGHDTSAPYDYGTVHSSLFEVLNDN